MRQSRQKVRLYILRSGKSSCFLPFITSDSLSLQKSWCSRVRNAAARSAPAVATSAASCAAW